VVFEIPRQPATEPSILETITGLTQILLGLLRRHPEKIHFVQRGNDSGPIAAQFAVEIHGMLLLIDEHGQYLIDLLFRWRDRRGIHGPGNQGYSVFFRLPLFRETHEGKKL